MIQKIPAAKRYLASHDWLTTYHLFSFADYFDPANMNFGVLRVFNDDTIDAHNGFGRHPHRDMEIVTIMLEGELTHTDSMGNSRTIRKGDVQYMSAGYGVVHSEVNNGSVPVHLYQIWLLPRHRDRIPEYKEMKIDVLTKNTLVPLVSGDDSLGALTIDSDATIYRGELESGNGVVYKLGQLRGLFIYIMQGGLVVNGVDMVAGDQLRIADVDMVTMDTSLSCVFFAIEVLM
jgi:redox-sensitive bicupin YhaK (pirin superfamily)